MSSIQQHLEDVYYNCRNMKGYDKLLKQAKIICRASHLGIALGGSTGMHLGHRNPGKLPGDLDFFTTSDADAWSFMFAIYSCIGDYAHHGKIYVQNRTDWCPEGTTAHYRMSSTLHMDMHYGGHWRAQRVVHRMRHLRTEV